MCARIQICVRPMRQSRSFLRGQSRNSKTQISPPTTPKVKPGRLLPPGQDDVWTTAAKYQTLARPAAAPVATIQAKCLERFDRSISTTGNSVHEGQHGGSSQDGRAQEGMGSGKGIPVPANARAAGTTPCGYPMTATDGGKSTSRAGHCQRLGRPIIPGKMAAPQPVLVAGGPRSRYRCRRSVVIPEEPRTQ